MIWDQELLVIFSPNSSLDNKLEFFIGSKLFGNVFAYCMAVWKNILLPYYRVECFKPTDSIEN